jgi:hypothetical protein
MLNIENDVSLALCQSVVTLVKAKTLVDRLSHGSELDRKLARLCGLPAGEDGTSFYRDVFPFCGRWEPSGASLLRQVPLEQTVGHSWRWQPESVPYPQRASLRDRLLALTEGSEQAEVCWIVPLGLYLAHEGKNRVAFLRQEGVSHYSALTTPYDYPAPDRLKLIQVAGTHGEEWWAVLDDDLIEPLRHPEWTVPVLSAYGVLITKQWPAEYASCASVRAKIVADDLGYSPPLGRPAISIKAMKMKELRDAEHTSASLLELENIQFRQGWRRVVLALIGIIAVVLTVRQPSLHDLSFFSFCLGALTIAGLLIFGKILSVPRRNLQSADI